MSDQLPDLLAATAAARPETTALVMGEERVTYSELAALAGAVAARLSEAGCRPGDRVCLLAPKAPITVAAMLGTLIAGCAYVPVDVAGAPLRAAAVVEAAAPAAVLVLGTAGSALVATLAGQGALGTGEPALRPGVPVLDLASVDLASAPDGPWPRHDLGSDPAAHLLFTSGSTGRPKGVVVRQASVLAFVRWAVRHFDMRAGERLSGHPPLHFDLSTFDVYATLLAGAELHLLPPQTVLPRQLADFVTAAELHQFFCVPSAMTYMAHYGALPESGFPSLRRVLWCGEVLPTGVLMEWMRRVPQARYTNLYGPTEATIASSFYDVPAMPSDEREPIPIGVACDGEDLLVLGDEGGVAPDGELGELCIGGVGLSPGYWRDEATTARAFGRDPRPGREEARIYRTGDLARRDPDGVFHFVGRLDSQIKSRGYRIELGEIETAIASLSAIAECAVVGVATDGFEGTAICCAFALRDGEEADPTALRSALRDALPSYMMPAHWLALDALPKNVNGKIDRRALRERFAPALVTAG